MSAECNATEGSSCPLILILHWNQKMEILKQSLSNTNQLDKQLNQLQSNINYYTLALMQCHVFLFVDNIIIVAVSYNVQYNI